MILYIENKPISYALGFAYKSHFLLLIPGFDPEYRVYRIGTYMTMKLFSDLVEDDRVQMVDYGFGDAEYKRHFATGYCYEQDVLIFSRRLGPLLVNLARSLTMKVSDAMLVVMRRFNVERRVKKLARLTIASGQGSKSDQR